MAHHHHLTLHQHPSTGVHRALQSPSCGSHGSASGPERADSHRSDHDLALTCSLDRPSMFISVPLGLLEGKLYIKVCFHCQIKELFLHSIHTQPTTPIHSLLTISFVSFDLVPVFLFSIFDTLLASNNSNSTLNSSTALGGIRKTVFL
ncbi:uncharacterized protein HMPREF1120_02549 [Exophiala dermatitidis NIH/UT8656]|uniref:Uncharacterized protein n=1 Tax=Exophiala dermatitidis (strain ATCC 34100 / CBS 525.76 / NIH/UT8656) TaxID=858893 RepID=H6BTI3_EXODN|nr:uncharacterized protein HMPREF1120_02549 [Exophiala dermatitidis NIH/UT8656]EHY54380.1 hypothetical protein HMPREF1120_02549 [Exophiala dermatitidis NIH/UT8656]